MFGEEVVMVVLVLSKICSLYSINGIYHTVTISSAILSYHVFVYV